MNSTPTKGEFINLDGEQFYKIHNYDCMEDFFMTITSASDVWNFCWAQGGITAGRRNAEHALFPYYTCDKVSDMKSVTGAYTAIAVHTDAGTVFWEPFEPLKCNSARRYIKDESIERNIYKNTSGTKVWFEEINHKLALSFRYGWTSGSRYGLVRMAHIENLSSKEQKISILDGCQNILPSYASSALQNASSVLLDAYKQTDVDTNANIALFSLSSVVSDKAEPNEALLTNVSWFTTDDQIIIDPTAPKEFFEVNGDITKLNHSPITKGERGACFIARSTEIAPCSDETWYQVFDVDKDNSTLATLKSEIGNRNEALTKLKKDIGDTECQMMIYLYEADGIQKTAASMNCVHHQVNVMFNSMRGGFFADGGKINGEDFLAFVRTRNIALEGAAEKALGALATKTSIPRQQVAECIKNASNPQLERLFLGYLPIVFSRRHGDPSRPWNKFDIRLVDSKGNLILNYEGNWRDIFQNWEALLYSYPEYIESAVSTFVNAMTIDGYNPYRITRAGIDWEEPEPDNLWAQYGYWGDHQVIYLQKLLELLDNYKQPALLDFLKEPVFCSANVPYRIKAYSEILKNPRDTILFDRDLSNSLIKQSNEHGTDKKLVCGADGNPVLVNLTTKILQIIIEKAANIVPGGGIWMNTQRPEWNDANNALAGWGLSVVTLCYLERMLKFLIKIFALESESKFELPASVAQCMKELSEIFKNAEDAVLSDSRKRKAFVDKAQAAFETERNELYANGYGNKTETVSSKDIAEFLKNTERLTSLSIQKNKREDGLYHTYNTLQLTSDGMEINNLALMLEGQVAVLSSGLLSPEEALAVSKALSTSNLYEPRQKSYLLYPNKELPTFTQKNIVKIETEPEVLDYIEKNPASDLLTKDISGVWHFNAKFQNARLMREYIETMGKNAPSAGIIEKLMALYERTFNHHSFTGRSGTFYAYEGLGSIYWHMVSKLLLAVQENLLLATNQGSSAKAGLLECYKQIQQGLGYNKTPELYGAFPFDPYSHTPLGKGARQPGMTGQVKEEVLARFGELGLQIFNGQAKFMPQILDKSEYFDNKTLSFTWCGTNITYRIAKASAVEVTYADGSTEKTEGSVMSEKDSKELFARTGKISSVVVDVAE